MATKQSAGEKSFALLINTFFNRHTIISIVDHSNTDCDLMKRSESASVTFVFSSADEEREKSLSVPMNDADCDRLKKLNLERLWPGEK